MKQKEYIVGWQPVLALCHALRQNISLTVTPELLWVTKAGWAEKGGALRVLIERGVFVHQVDHANQVPQDVRQYFNVQGVVCAAVSCPKEIHEDDWLMHRCVMVCDGVQDPQNLGSLCRLACAMGVGALVLPKHNQVPITAVVRRVAQGAAERLPIVVVNNLVRWLQDRKKQGFWVYGTSERGQMPLDQVQFDAPNTILVVGSEGKGMRRLVNDTCDVVMCIATEKDFQSLNVVQAASMLTYEYHRQQGSQS